MRPNDLSNHLSNPNETTTGTLVKNILKHVCVLAFFLCLPLQIASANDAPLKLFAFAEGIRFDNELNLDTRLGFGTGLKWSTNRLIFSAEYSRVRSKQPFDIIGGEDALGITWQSILLGTGYRAINHPGWKIDLTINAGVLLFGNDAYTADLGTAGSLDIEANTETKFLLRPNLMVQKQLNKRVSLFLEPGVSITSLSGTRINTHLKGGIGFAIH